VVDGFYSFLGFPRLVSSAVVKKAIARGIQGGFFGYYSGSIPALGSDGKYQVPVARVRFSTAVTEDEIDLESGFLMMPQALPVTAPPPTTVGTGPTGATAGEPGGASTPTPTPPPDPPRDVEWEAPQGRGANRIRDSGFRGENEEHLLSAFCGRSGHARFLPSSRLAGREDGRTGMTRSRTPKGPHLSAPDREVPA